MKLTKKYVYLVYQHLIINNNNIDKVIKAFDNVISAEQYARKLNKKCVEVVRMELFN